MYEKKITCIRHQDELKKMLLIWNSGYKSMEVPVKISTSFLSRIPEPITHPHKRGWMQIFKFFKPTEIITTLALVSKMFYQISMIEEIWQDIV